MGEALAYEVDKLSEPYDIQCRLHGRKHQRKVKITVGDTHVFQPNKRLSTMLGLGPEREYAKGIHLAETGLKVPVSYDICNLYVYCDIVEHVVVSDVTAPLLRIVETKPNARRARMHTTFDTSILVPVQKRSFNTIAVEIMTEEGKPAPFATGWGKSHVVLEFRKLGLLNRLL